MAPLRFDPTSSTTADAGLSRGAPGPLVRAVQRLEQSRSLDPAARLVDRLSEPVGRPKPFWLLSGGWLGHALHPLLTDFPLGCWASGSLIDLFGGDEAQPAAQGLIGFGVALALPTAAAGLAEWRHAGARERRVGVVHAGLNMAVLGFYAASLVPRRKGRRARATALGVAGGLMAWVSGYLGGHLSIVRKMGTREAAFVAGPGPAPDRG